MQPSPFVVRVSHKEDINSTSVVVEGTTGFGLGSERIFYPRITYQCDHTACRARSGGARCSACRFIGRVIAMLADSNPVGAVIRVWLL